MLVYNYIEFIDDEFNAHLSAVTPAQLYDKIYMLWSARARDNGYAVMLPEHLPDSATFDDLEATMLEANTNDAIKLHYSETEL